MSYQTLDVRSDGAVTRVALNRPAVRNAFNEAQVAELTDWAHTAAGTPGLRVAVLEGRGPVFCAGADLGWMERAAAFSHDENVKDAATAARMFDALDRLPLVLVARVHGAAFGGGAGLAAVADVTVAAADTTFSFSEAKLGLIPAVISPFVIARIGHSAARHLFVTGARFSAEHARDIGLVHEVVDSDALDARVAQYVREALTSGPGAVAAIKTLLRELSGGRPDTINLTSRALAARRESEEGQEGIRAFLEKRKPGWIELR